MNTKPKLPMSPPDNIIIEFRDGHPFVEIRENQSRRYRIQFINKSNNFIEYQTDINSNSWAICTALGDIDWRIRVWGVYHYYFMEKEMKITNL